MLEIWKEISDNNKTFGVLIDLSKAFHCVIHDFLIAELHAHGLCLALLN